MLRVVEGGEASSFGARVPDRSSANMPLKLTSFVGREREISEVKRLFGEARLLTLTGPVGSGKTRLALAVTHEVAPDFEEGAWWVGLGPLSCRRRSARRWGRVSRRVVRRPRR